MVSNEEIKRRLELRRKGLDPDKNTFNADAEVYKPPLKSEPKKTIKCPECGTMNLDSSKFCINCGHELKKKEKEVIVDEPEFSPVVCPECGKENAESSKFCIGCGKNLKDDPVEAPKEDATQINPKTEAIPSEDPGLTEAAEETGTIEEPDLSPEEDISVEEAEEENFFEELKQAKELLDMGAITEEEYEKIKNSYLKKFQ